MTAAERPWVRFYGDVPETLEYPEVTLYEALMTSVRRTPDAVAYDFFGTTATYRELGEEVDRLADGLASLGLGAGDRMTISMPTCPQGVIAFYAAIKLGAAPSMIHPLSTPGEIEGFLNRSGSRVALGLDAFYRSFGDIEGQTPLETLILTRIGDYLSPVKRVGFWAKKGRKIEKVPPDPRVRWWSDLMKEPHPSVPAARVGAHEPAAILYSGGTTGTPKGIVLSHWNLVTVGLQVRAWIGLGPQDTILAALPIFHGFGLAALVNAGLLSGCRLLLVPTFTPETTAELMQKKKPTLIAGVPTLYEALIAQPGPAQGRPLVPPRRLLGRRLAAGARPPRLRGAGRRAGRARQAAGGLRADRGRDRHRRHAHQRVAAGQHRRPLPRHARRHLPGRRARGGARRRGGRDLRFRAGGDARLPRRPGCDRGRAPGAPRRADLAAHRRHRPHGRGRVLLLHRPGSSA